MGDDVRQAAECVKEDAKFIPDVRGSNRLRLSAIAVADAYLASAPADDGPWRPIADQPPEPGAFIIAATPRLDGPWGIETARYIGRDEEGHDVRNGYGSTIHPTHWLPLPAPPNVGEPAKV